MTIIVAISNPHGTVIASDSRATDERGTVKTVQKIFLFGSGEHCLAVGVTGNLRLVKNDADRSPFCEIFDLCQSAFDEMTQKGDIESFLESFDSLFREKIDEYMELYKDFFLTPTSYPTAFNKCFVSLVVVRPYQPDRYNLGLVQYDRDQRRGVSDPGWVEFGSSGERIECTSPFRRKEAGVIFGGSGSGKEGSSLSQLFPDIENSQYPVKDALSAVAEACLRDCHCGPPFSLFFWPRVHDVPTAAAAAPSASASPPAAAEYRTPTLFPAIFANGLLTPSTCGLPGSMLPLLPARGPEPLLPLVPEPKVDLERQIHDTAHAAPAAPQRPNPFTPPQSLL